MSDDTSPPTSKVRSGAKSWVRIAKAIIAVAVLAGLVMAGRSAIGQWKSETTKIQTEIANIDSEISSEADSAERQRLVERRSALRASLPYPSNLNWSRIAGAAGIYAIGLLPSAMLLRRAVVSLGGQPRLMTVIVAQLLGHLGKYVPGKAMVLVLRGGVLARDGVRPMTSTISIFLETFLMMAVGAVVAAIATIGISVPTWITVLSIATAVLASVPTLPPLLRLIATRITQTDRDELGKHIHWGLFFSGWAWSLLSWLLIGVSFTLLVTAIPTAETLPRFDKLFPVATAAICLAMVIGFASLLPGGAGVRELVLTSVLGIVIGPAHGLLAAIIARMTFMVVESVLAAACALWLRWDGSSRRSFG